MFHLGVPFAYKGRAVRPNAPALNPKQTTAELVVVTSESCVVTSKLVVLTSKSGVETSESVVLTSMSDVETSKSAVLTSNSNVVSFYAKSCFSN